MQKARTAWSTRTLQHDTLLYHCILYPATLKAEHFWKSGSMKLFDVNWNLILEESRNWKQVEEIVGHEDKLILEKIQTWNNSWEQTDFQSLGEERRAHDMWRLELKTSWTFSWSAQESSRKKKCVSLNFVTHVHSAGISTHCPHPVLRRSAAACLSPPSALGMSGNAAARWWRPLLLHPGTGRSGRYDLR